MSLEHYRINNQPLAAFGFGSLKFILELIFGVAWYPERRKFYQFVTLDAQPELYMNAVWVNVAALAVLAVLAVLYHKYTAEEKE